MNKTNLNYKKTLHATNKALFFFLLFTFHFLLSATAQSSFTTKLSAQKIGVGQRLEVSFEMTNVGSVDNFAAPNFSGFSVVGGPMQSTENTIVNGHSSSRSTISYFLQPLKTGKISIEGAHAVIDGKAAASNKIMVDVQAKDVDLPPDPATDPSLNPFNDPFFAPNQTPTEPAQDEAFAEAERLRPGEDPQKKIDKNLFIKVFTNKTTVYEGEPIVATYKVYTRLDMTAGVTKRPSFSGFSAFDMEDPSQTGSMEKFNGQNYTSYTIRKVQLYPLQNGQLTLEPVEVDCDIKFVKLDHANEPNFNPNDPANQKQVHYVLKSQAVNITALPFPEQGKPANFKGAVGNFTIQAATSASEIGKDDAEKLQITITGAGNFSAVQAPDVAWPSSVEAYDPKQKDNLDQTISPISGTKTFEYVFICHQPGRDTIPPISFSYFDAAAKTYKTISTSPFFLNILPKSKHPQKALPTEGTNLPADFVEVAKYGLPIFAIGLVIFLIVSVTKKQKKKELQILEEKKRKEAAWEKLVANAQRNKQQTPKTTDHESFMPAGFSEVIQTNTAQKEEEDIKMTVALPESDALLWMGDNKSFFQALKNDILKTLSDIANSFGLNKSELLEILKQKGKDETVLLQIKTLLDECDAVAYSPLQTPPDRHAILEEAKFLLGKL